MCRSCFVSSVLVLVFSASVFGEDWTQWRGPNNDGKSRETGLLASWSAEGPKLLWSCENMGFGFSNIAVVGDRIYSMGDHGNDCNLYALDKKDGNVIWKTRVGRSGGTTNHKGPRCTPAVDGNRIFAIGQFGDLVCADVKTGKLIWSINVKQKLGGRVMSTWDCSMSPIIDGNQVVLPIGGEQGTVIAFDKNSDELKILWQTKQITDAAAYTSLVPVEIGGVKQYILRTANNLYGISAAEGKTLWHAEAEGRTAVCSDPVYWKEGDDTCYILTSCAYGIGAFGYKVTGKGADFKVEQIYEAPSLTSHHGGMVEVNGHFYLLTNFAMVCVDPKNGQTLWNNKSVGKGSIFAVDGKLILRKETGDGDIAMIVASPTEYKELGRFPQPDRTDKNSWTYPTVVDGRLYIRDQGLLLCYEVK